MSETPLPQAEGKAVENIKDNSDTTGLEKKVKTIEELIHVVVVVLQVSLAAAVIAVMFGFGAWYATTSIL